LIKLESIVGTGKVVGFANYWVPNPNHSLEVRVHTDGDTASPDTYPLPHPRGIIKTGGEHDPGFDEIAAQLQKASINK
jgi:hypothetical protein